MLRSHNAPVLIAALAFAIGFAAAPASAAAPVLPAGTTVVLTDVPAEPVRSAPPAAAPGSLAAPVVTPSAGPWILTFVVDPDNGFGTTTLLAVRNDDPVIDANVLVEFFDAGFNLFHDVSLTLEPNQVQSFNLRDQPNVPNGAGLTYGLVRVTAEIGEQVAVDTFRVTPDEAFASGGLAPDFSTDQCDQWAGRVLLGGGFDGGTTLTFIVDGPRGPNPGSDPPTISGDLYTEDGTFINGFNIFTDAFVLEIDAEMLLDPAPPFTGSFELLIDGTDGGGHVTVEHKAEGLYSVTVDGVCLDTVVAAE